MTPNKAKEKNSYHVWINPHDLKISSNKTQIKSDKKDQGKISQNWRKGVNTNSDLGGDKVKISYLKNHSIENIQKNGQENFYCG